MKKYENNSQSPKAVFVQIDILQDNWRVAVRSKDVGSSTCIIRGSWEELQRILERYKGYRIRAVYDVGDIGFWLHERLIDYGVECDVLPPSLLIPQENVF
jgi:hypothetical protein